MVKVTHLDSHPTSQGMLGLRDAGSQREKECQEEKQKRLCEKTLSVLEWSERPILTAILNAQRMLSLWTRILKENWMSRRKRKL